MFEAQVHTVPLASPEDVGAVEGLFDAGIVDPAHVVAIMAQTEGDSYVRGYSTLALQRLFARRLNLSLGELSERIPMLMIAGTAGLVSPHATFFVNKSVTGNAGNCVARLAVGVGRTRLLLTDEYGNTTQVRLVAVRVVVIGNVPGAPGGYVAAHSVMERQLDVLGARAAFKAAGLRLEDGILVPEDRAKVAAVFVNAGADYLPHCLGRRHTMRSDVLAQYSGHVAKAVAHANVSSIVQDTLVLGKAGAEHQGKPGSNLVCVIANHG